ncbi:hypothetical protein C8R46DRAFT_1058593 [Mycena filopes]|nr:hypothetical protein C8R46DRAFT_1058593 [Mycena filopes]
MQFSIQLISALALFTASALAVPLSSRQSVVDAECTGKAVGDACSITFVLGTFQGHCVNPTDEGRVDTNQVFCDALNNV